MKPLSVAIVGIDHPNTDKSKSNRRFELLQCDFGEPVEFRLEPKNPYDEHAIAVWSVRGIQIGYLPSERAVLIGSIMRRGVEVRAIFQGLAERVAYCRVAFDEDPVLPPAREDAAETDRPTSNLRNVDESGFWPDEDGPEWGA